MNEEKNMTESELIMALSIERLALIVEIEELKLDVKREKSNGNLWWEMYKMETNAKEALEKDKLFEVTEP